MKLKQELKKSLPKLTDQELRVIVDLSKQWMMLSITDSMNQADIYTKAFGNGWEAKELNYPKIFDLLVKKVTSE